MALVSFFKFRLPRAKSMLLLLVAFSVAIITQGAGDIFAGRVDFGNELINAVDGDKLSQVARLLDKGADVNARGKFDSTALHRAVINSNVEMVRLLLARGANVNDRDFGNATAMHFAARITNPDILKDLLLNGADIDLFDNQFYTPLHRAVASDNIATALTLIRAGANIDSVNKDGENIILSAVKNNNSKLVEELFVLGADINKLSNNGLSAYGVARAEGFSAVENIFKLGISAIKRKRAFEQSPVIYIQGQAQTDNMPAYLKKEVESLSKNAQGQRSVAVNSVNGGLGEFGNDYTQLPLSQRNEKPQLYYDEARGEEFLDLSGFSVNSADAINAVDTIPVPKHSVEVSSLNNVPPALSESSFRPASFSNTTVVNPDNNLVTPRKLVSVSSGANDAPLRPVVQSPVAANSIMFDQMASPEADFGRVPAGYKAPLSGWSGYASVPNSDMFAHESSFVSDEIASEVGASMADNKALTPASLRMSSHLKRRGSADINRDKYSPNYSALSRYNAANKLEEVQANYVTRSVERAVRSSFDVQPPKSLSLPRVEQNNNISAVSFELPVKEFEVPVVVPRGFTPTVPVGYGDAANFQAVRQLTTDEFIPITGHKKKDNRIGFADESYVLSSGASSIMAGVMADVTSQPTAEPKQEILSDVNLHNGSFEFLEQELRPIMAADVKAHSPFSADEDNFAFGNSDKASKLQKLEIQDVAAATIKIPGNIDSDISITRQEREFDFSKSVGFAEVAGEEFLQARQDIPSSLKFKSFIEAITPKLIEENNAMQETNSGNDFSYEEKDSLKLVVDDSLRQEVAREVVKSEKVDEESLITPLAVGEQNLDSGVEKSSDESPVSYKQDVQPKASLFKGQLIDVQSSNEFLTQRALVPIETVDAVIIERKEPVEEKLAEDELEVIKQDKAVLEVEGMENTSSDIIEVKQDINQEELPVSDVEIYVANDIVNDAENTVADSFIPQDVAEEVVENMSEDEAEVVDDTYKQELTEVVSDSGVIKESADSLVLPELLQENEVIIEEAKSLPKLPVKDDEMLALSASSKVVVIGDFANAVKADEHFQAVSEQKGYSYPYRVASKIGQKGISVIVGPVVSNKDAQIVCDNFKNSDKLNCEIAEVGKITENYDFAVGKSIYSFIGEFSSEGEIDDYIAKYIANADFHISKIYIDDKDIIVIRLGPVAEFATAKDICDKYTQIGHTCKIDIR